MLIGYRLIGHIELNEQFKLSIYMLMSRCRTCYQKERANFSSHYHQHYYHSSYFNLQTMFANSSF